MTAQPLMAGKKGLILGIANDRSLAWGIAKAVHAQGAEVAVTYQGDALLKRVRPLAEHLGSDTFLHIDADSVGRITARAPGELALAAGDKVALTPRPDRIHRFDSDGKALHA